jgi:hypothetical protein
MIVEITRGVATSDGANMMPARNEDWSYYIVCAMPDVLSNFLGDRNVIYVEANLRADQAMTVQREVENPGWPPSEPPDQLAKDGVLFS